jgi:hypothetical protein
VMREGWKSSGVSEARGSGAGERRRWRFPTGVSRRGEGAGYNRWGPVDRETRERRPAREGVIRKEKRIFREENYINAARMISACGDGTAGGLAGPEAERDAGSAGPKARKRISGLKKWIFEFTKALEICRRRFRRNFDMRVFPKFF